MALIQPLCAALGLYGVAAAPPANMVANPGFEEEATGWNLPALYAVDTAVSHTGRCSLRYHNEPGGPYLIAGQGLRLRPGKCYRFSVWVRTEGIASSDTGATISLEWSGPQGYVGGAYAPGITGTADWTRIVFESAVIPEDVTGGSVILYGRPGTSGTAWFDDVEVAELAAPSVQFGFAGYPAGQKVQPVVAGLTAPDVRLQARLAPRSGWSSDDALLGAKVLLPGGPAEVTPAPFRGDTATLVVPGEELPLGETGIEVSLVSRADGRPVAGDTLRVVRQELLRLSIATPNPAGMLGLEPSADEALGARVWVEPTAPGQQMHYRARLFLMSGRRRVGEALETTVAASSGWQPLPSLPTVALAPGLYDLCCELCEGASRDSVARATAVVTRGDPAGRPANATGIGPNRMLAVEGRPFFPMGFYILSSLETVQPADQPWRWQTGTLYPSYYLPILDRLAKSHFNCFIDYGSTMGGMEAAASVLDAAQERGLRAIFSVKDLMPGAYWQAYTQNLPWKDLREATRNVVSALREHPALIAWYVNDEVIRRDQWAGAVDVYRETRAADPWHPTYAVHYDYQRLAQYRTACDVIGTDPYALLGDIGFTARSWHEARRQLPPEMPFWAVVQCFGPGYETSQPSETREPTYEEERAATLAAIAEGATGIIYYCFHSLQRSPRFEERFEELNRIAGEVQDLVPIISLPDAPVPVQVQSGTVSVLAKQGPDCLYVILVSTLRDPQEVVLRLPWTPASVRVVGSGQELRSKGERLKLHLGALDAQVLQIRG